MSNLNVHETTFVKDWKKQNKAILLSIHPNVSEKKINNFLDRVADEHITNRAGEIVNNYNHRKQRASLLQIVDWYEKKKPIVAGYGCLFMNQDQEPNPLAMMQDNFMKLRKIYKNKMYEYVEGAYEYSTYDMRQNNEKINNNSLVNRLFTQ